jgi:hypothetical protein
VEDAENNNTYNNDNFYTNNNYSNVNNNLLELPTPSSPGARVWQRWSRGLLGLNCLFLPAPRRYMAVPRSPTLTDRIDLEQAGARYRADRQVLAILSFLPAPPLARTGPAQLTETAQVEVGESL